MVGKGYLKPDMSIARSDTPMALRRLTQDCIKYDRDERPLFPQVLQLIYLLIFSMTVTEALTFPYMHKYF